MILIIIVAAGVDIVHVHESVCVRKREEGREGGREREREGEKEREGDGEREATFLLLSACSTHLFVHECCFNTVSGYIVRVDETEHFEEELLSISVRHDAL